MAVGTVFDAPESVLQRIEGKVTPVGLDTAEREYYRALSRWWTIDDDPTVTLEDSRRLLLFLEELYALLRKNGRIVPVRLPVVKNYTHTGGCSDGRRN
ncbi:MAG: hypothetical protein VB050_08185 [Geobacteraceae bacterium]|nr:hypothetical protein [Geobacteraceae bacterium]